MDARAGSLSATIDTGRPDVVDVHVPRPGRSSQVVTRDSDGNVRRWCVQTGDLLGALAASGTKVITGGRPGDGRPVLVTVSDTVMMWDLSSGLEIVIREVPPLTEKVRDVALTARSMRMRIPGGIHDHRTRWPNGLTDTWSASYRGSRLAADSELLAVPTEGRVRLRRWDLAEGGRRR